MPSVSLRKLAVLSLLEAGDAKGRPRQSINGITRLQKLLFLTWTRLPRTSPDRQIQFDMGFTPERFGPADLDLYPDLDFLIALGHIEKNPREGVASPGGPGIEEATERALSFAYLMGDEEDAGLLAEVEELDEAYSITDQGMTILHQILGQVAGPAKVVTGKVVTATKDVRREYGDWALQRLLRYVYSEYPEMTTASEIRERVLGPQ
jgi:hypothetical protein